jgi:hypothetical protein
MLTAGVRFSLIGLQWRVAYANASRAHCVATSTTRVTVPNPDGTVRTFTATLSKTLDLSPDTDITLLKELGL